jgi:hypothetical protein
MPSKRGRDHGKPTGKEKGTTTMRLWLWPGKNPAQRLTSIPKGLESRTQGKAHRKMGRWRCGHERKEEANAAL